MVWFRQFLAPISENRFRLETDALHPVSLGIGDESEWADDLDAVTDVSKLVGTTSPEPGPLLGL